MAGALISRLPAFLKTAQDLFGLGGLAGRGPGNPHYMYLPLRLSTNRLLSDETAPEEVWNLESPFFFLSGNEEHGRPAPLGQPSASLPSVSVLVGDYGLGKTEFIFQFCDHLLCNVEMAAPAPLPVSLAMCRWMNAEAASVLGSRPALKDFTNLLFGPILKRMTDVESDFIETELLPAIHRGDVYLILDGVDELIANPAQHVHFFEGIRALLDCSGASPSLFRCLVSLRFEYISAVDTPSGRRLMQGLNGRGANTDATDVHFLHLDFLNDSWIGSYLRHSLPVLGENIDKLRAFPGFFELLRRPLFLHMLTLLDSSNKVFKASELGDAARLIRVFIEVVDAQAPKSGGGEAPYFVERDDFTLQSGFVWDTDLLASAALDNHDRTGGQFTFTIDDIARFLVPAPGSDTPAHVPTREEALLSVHKCPYLQQISAKRVVFSHKVFLEYFVCRGIVLDLQKSEVGKSAFDRLVLNSDMRRFLRSMVQEHYRDSEAWYRRTQNSYALDQPAQWKLSNGYVFHDIQSRLESIRRTLLDSMTDLRTFDTGLTRVAIGDFFEYEGHNLHPRYLMYNYEAVAVYLWRHRWKHEDMWLLHDFEERLHNRALRTMSELEGPGVDDREGMELLLERICDIARRLQFEPIIQMRLMAYVSSDRIKSRMTSSQSAVDTVMP
jgi:hypothetical protein